MEWGRSAQGPSRLGGLQGRRFESLDHGNAFLRHWNLTIAPRVQGSSTWQLYSGCSPQPVSRS